MEAAILNLLIKLSSPILEEFGLLWGIEKQHQKLKSKLLTIEAVLQDAEERQVKDRAVKVWLRKLKDVAYDADDLVDEFMVEALRRKVEIRDGMQKKVRNFFSPSNPLVFRFKMTHKMQELRERLDEISQEKNDFHFKEGVPGDNQPRISSTRETHSFVIESEVYGRDDEKATIIDSLINSDEDEVLSVISIIGLGGLGKTTLAQLVYNDESIAAHFALKMWVYVSEYFDVGRLVQLILQSAMNVRSDSLSMDLLQTRLRAELSGKRYLLVLDDVWNEVREKWDKLETLLKCGAQGSKIIVTTRSKTVASIMGTRPAHAHYLATLSVNDSWSLFEKLAHPDPKLVSIGKEIVKKCGGVPLAVKTLGGLMSSKRSEREWLSVNNSKLWELQDTDEVILAALKLSYDQLTPHLKQCFAYCVVFLKCRSIDKHKLIKQWVAQGFIQSGDENELLEEEKGVDFFNDLLSRSLFHVVKEYGQMKYRMHDLIHDLLKYIAGTESIIVEEVFTQVVPKETRHLTLCGKKWATESKKALEKCKKLHSILSPFGSIDVNIYSRFRFLKVLDLSWSDIGYLPNSFGKLIHLRYLDISHTKIQKLPKAICNLHSLQTLILDGIPIKKLPKDIKRMTSLRHIECDSSQELTMPNGIGELTCLQKLKKFTISQEGAGIEELKCLNQLQGELCIKGLENVRNENCAREAKLMEKQRLCSLSLSWSNVETTTTARANLDNHVIEKLEPHSNLKELSILKYMGLNYPSWIQKLTNLVRISLSNCNNCEHLPPLGQLHFLEALEISYMKSVKYIFVIDEAYNDKDIIPSLKELKLSHMPSLEGWWPHQADNEEHQEEKNEQVLRGCLRRLAIIDCPKLTQLPRLLFSSALELLELHNVGCERIEMSSSQSLKALKIVHLSDMQHLEEFSLQRAHGIEDLHVENCPRMIRLPHHLPSLRRLQLYQCNKMLVEFVANYFSLENLYITGFQMDLLEKIWQNDASLPSLESDDCPKSVSLSNILKNLSTLESLGISDFPDLMLLPDDLKCLGSVKSLSISRSCLKQTSISGVLPSLRILKLIGCKNLERLHFDGLQNLTTIESFDCPKLWSSSSDWVRNLTSLVEVVIESAESLPESFGNLISLRFLWIRSSPALTRLPESTGNLKSLDRLYISSCGALTCLPESIGNLTSLADLKIEDCQAMRSWPESVGNLISLKILTISSCPEMRALPESIGNLTSLNNLFIYGFPILKALPESTGNLKSLDLLNIHSCDALTCLPESIGNLTSLTDLKIEDCQAMRSLPESIGNLISLKILTISSCPEMRALPESIGNLKSLKNLGILGCSILKALPESTGNLKSLFILWINDCPEMETLPKGSGQQSLTNLQYLLINNCPILKRRLLNKKKIKKWRMGKDLNEVAHVPCILIDQRDPREEESSDDDGSSEEEQKHKCSNLLHCI